VASPDPEGFSLLTKVLAAGTAIVAPLYGFWKLLDRKANKKDVESEFGEVRAELQHQRGVIAKVFDHIRENEQRAQDRHERLMERLTNGRN